MILHQFYLNCLAHASYLVGDEQLPIAWLPPHARPARPRPPRGPRLARARQHPLARHHGAPPPPHTPETAIDKGCFPRPPPPHPPPPPAIPPLQLKPPHPHPPPTP